MESAESELATAQAELDAKQRELDLVQAKFDAAMKEKQVRKFCPVVAFDMSKS